MADRQVDVGLVSHVATQPVCCGFLRGSVHSLRRGELAIAKADYRSLRNKLNSG